MFYTLELSGYKSCLIGWFYKLALKFGCITNVEQHPYLCKNRQTILHKENIQVFVINKQLANIVSE
jgi:hypothetical protein